MSTAPTPEQVQALAEARTELDDWATGRRSHMNEFVNLESVPADRAQTLTLVAQADAAEVQRLAAYVTASDFIAAEREAAVREALGRVAFALDTHGDEAWGDSRDRRSWDETQAMKDAYHHAAAVAGGLEPCLDEHLYCREGR